MSQASPFPRDWTEQRALCGYSVYVWQINLASLLAVLFVAFVGFYFSTPFIPFLVRQLGVTDPRAVAVWSGVLIGLGRASAAIVSPLWGRLADRIGGRLCSFAQSLDLRSSICCAPWPRAFGSSLCCDY
jgi:MFS family permease